MVLNSVTGLFMSGSFFIRTAGQASSLESGSYFAAVRRSWQRSSLLFYGLDAGGFDHGFPPRDFGGNRLRELLRRVADSLIALGGQSLRDIRSAQRPQCLVPPFSDDRPPS